MIILALLLAPLPPPPPADSLGAARALIADHPPSQLIRSAAIAYAVSTATDAGLVRAGINYRAGTPLKRFLEKYDQLRPLIVRHVPSDLTLIEAGVVDCIADRIARTMGPDEIAEVRRFMVTPVGVKYWNAAGPNGDAYAACYAKTLDLHASDEDYRAIAVKPPAPEQARPGAISSAAPAGDAHAKRPAG